MSNNKRIKVKIVCSSATFLCNGNINSNVLCMSTNIGKSVNLKLQFLPEVLAISDSCVHELKAL